MSCVLGWVDTHAMQPSSYHGEDNVVLLYLCIIRARNRSWRSRRLVYPAREFLLGCGVVRCLLSDRMIPWKHLFVDALLDSTCNVFSSSEAALANCNVVGYRVHCRMIRSRKYTMFAGATRSIFLRPRSKSLFIGLSCLPLSIFSE